MIPSTFIVSMFDIKLSKRDLKLHEKLILSVPTEIVRFPLKTSPIYL